MELFFFFFFFFFPQFCNPFFHPVPIAYVILGSALPLPTWGGNGLTSCFLLCMRSPSCFFSPDSGDFPGLDVARGRNTLFQPVPSPPSGAPAGQGEALLRP